MKETEEADHLIKTKIFELYNLRSCSLNF